MPTTRRGLGQTPEPVFVSRDEIDEDGGSNRVAPQIPTFVSVDTESFSDYMHARQSSMAMREAESETERVERVERERVEAVARLNWDRTGDDVFTHVCDMCGRGVMQREVANSNLHEVEGRGSVCEDCYRLHFSACCFCGLRVNTLSMYRVANENSDRCCSSCAEVRSACPRCDDIIASSDDEVPISEDECAEWNLEEEACVCPNCHEYIDNHTASIETSRAGSVQFRRYSTKIHKKFCSNEQGKIVKSNRLFSAELETKYTSYDEAVKASNEVTSEVGIAEDGSIDGHGIEWQTPKLKGEAGEALLMGLCSVLQKRKFETNASCGLHIHLDGGTAFLPTGSESPKQANGHKVKLLFLMYLVFEDVLHSMLPASRRKNQYCKPMKNYYHVSEVLNAPNLEALETIWYRASTPAYIANCKQDKKHGSRYCGINMHTLLSDNHMEVRYHSGTIIAEKALEWINLHCLIMDAIASGKVQNVENITDAQDETSLSDKAELLFDLIELAPASRKYFRKRQEKFMKRSALAESAL